MIGCYDVKDSRTNLQKYTTILHYFHYVCFMLTLNKDHKKGSSVNPFQFESFEYFEQKTFGSIIFQNTQMTIIYKWKHVEKKTSRKYDDVLQVQKVKLKGFLLSLSYIKWGGLGGLKMSCFGSNK